MADIQKIVDAVISVPAQERVGILKAAQDCQFGTDSIASHEFNYFWKAVDAVLQETETVPAAERKLLYGDATTEIIKQLEPENDWLTSDLIDFNNQLTDFPDETAEPTEVDG